MTARRTTLFCVLGLALIALSARPLRADTNDPCFYFVQISDTHFSGGQQGQIRKVIDEINALPLAVRCVVHTGDVTADAMQRPSAVSNAVATLAKIRFPVHAIPGNHDIHPDRFAADATAFTNAFGPLVKQFEVDGVVFLGLYTEPLARSFDVPGYRPLEELERRLKSVRGRPVIVFHHSPDVSDFYNLRFHGGWNDATRREWTRVLNAYNVKAVLAGHFHRDEFHWIGRVPLFVSGAVATYWSRTTNYRIYEYRDGRVSYRTQYVP